MKYIYCIVCGCALARSWRARNCITMMWCTSRWKKCRKRSTRDMKSPSSGGCERIWKRIRPSGNRRRRRESKARRDGRAGPFEAQGKQARPYKGHETQLSELRGAVATALCCDWNRHRALRAVFCGGWRGRCRFVDPVIHQLNDDEHAEGHDQEVDDRVQKYAV